MRRRVGPGLNNATFKEKLEHFKFISIATIVSVAYIGCSTPYLVRSAYLIEAPSHESGLMPYVIMTKLLDIMFRNVQTLLFNILLYTL